MASVEVKYALRKIEFPDCANEALKKIESLINGRAPTIKHMDLALDLMAEFVFWEKDRRGNKRPADLSCIQEVQLLEVLISYFQNPTRNEITKNTTFLSLFGPSVIHIRLKILSKLVSLGISLSCAPLLTAAGAWMQQLGCTSNSSLHLARNLVKDYFAIVVNVLNTFKMLPTIAPQFTANFLTAIAEIYLTDGKVSVFTKPPDALLETITGWITDNPSVCLAAQRNPALFPAGGIVMPVITPIAGLFKWCILAPLLELKNKNSNKNIVELYAKLHLALLESILELKSGGGLPNVVCAQHITYGVAPLQFQIHDLVRTPADQHIESTIQVSLDRLAQAIQVTIASKCMYGNIQDLLIQLAKLTPKNRLLTIVLNTHRVVSIS